MSSDQTKNIVKEYDNFLTPAECDYIIQFASSRLGESKVYADKDNDARDTNVRDSRQAWIHDSDDAFAQKLSERISNLTKISSKHFEALQVVQYNKGGFYKPHYDACVGTEEFCRRANQQFNGQQRYITFLIYLNDDLKGGETHFPNIPYTVKPKKGKAVMFYSVDAQNKVLSNSLHGGNPVLSGSKWICNKWIHLPPEGPPNMSFEPYSNVNPNKNIQKSICESSFNGIGVL
jgi:prolyl 4-hydroxylase